MPGGKAMTRETIDVSPFGVKVRLDDGMGPGTTVRLRLLPPDRRPLNLESVVGRSDTDGRVFVFVNLSGDEHQRLKALVDHHRGA
jgi:PilZ domain